VAEQAELAYLSAGNSFGELALIKNQPRKATIICLENCYFMTLSKENYLRILGKFFSKKLDEKIDFLHSVKIFNKWSKKSIERIHFFFKPKTFKKNEIIYKIGEEPYGVYFIVSGVIELTIDNNQTALADFPKSLKVALITDKDVLGDEEILLGINRKYNAKCYSKVLETFWISKEDFLEQINKESLKKLKIRNFSRDYIRSSRLKSVQTSHAKLRSPSIPKKKEIITKNYFTINKNFITNTKTHRQNSNFSNKLIESIKKKSKLDTPSPTSSILVNCTVSQTPRVTNFFHNSKGFQPFKNNPSGVFKKISDRIKYLYML
jgi:CRP-like cAMP-binding protein